MSGKEEPSKSLKATLYDMIQERYNREVVFNKQVQSALSKIYRDYKDKPEIMVAEIGKLVSFWGECSDHSDYEPIDYK